MVSAMKGFQLVEERMEELLQASSGSPLRDWGAAIRALLPLLRVTLS